MSNGYGFGKKDYTQLDKMQGILTDFADRQVRNDLARIRAQREAIERQHAEQVYSRFLGSLQQPQQSTVSQQVASGQGGGNVLQSVRRRPGLIEAVSNAIRTQGEINTMDPSQASAYQPVFEIFKQLAPYAYETERQMPEKSGATRAPKAILLPDAAGMPQVKTRGGQVFAKFQWVDPVTHEPTPGQKSFYAKYFGETGAGALFDVRVNEIKQLNADMAERDEYQGTLSVGRGYNLDELRKRRKSPILKADTKYRDLETGELKIAKAGERDPIAEKWVGLNVKIAKRKLRLGRPLDKWEKEILSSEGEGTSKRVRVRIRGRDFEGFEPGDIISISQQEYEQYKDKMELIP